MIFAVAPQISASSIRCALGNSLAEVGTALLAGHSGEQLITLPDYGRRDFPYFPLDDAVFDESINARQRIYQLVDECIAEVLENSGLSSEARHRCGLFLGSSSFAMGASEQEYRLALQGGRQHLLFAGEHYGDIAHHLMQTHRLHGGDYTFSTACTSSANALLYAGQMVAIGKLDHAVVVGVELFNRTTLFGFDSMQLLERGGYRPFDAQRNGMVLGEGVSAVVISNAAQGDLRHNVRLLGGASNSDPQGITGSTAAMMASAMSDALAAASVDAKAIDLVRSHGTGSLSNDQSEAEALHAVFGEDLPPLVALKGALGHTLGACGIVELVALLACLEQGSAPATVGFRETDEELQCTPLTTPLPFVSGKVMLNHFGFGGNNTSLLIEVAAP